MKEIIHRSTRRKISNVSRNKKITVSSRTSKNLFKIKKIKHRSSHKNTEVTSSTSIEINNEEDFTVYYSEEENKTLIKRYGIDLLSLGKMMEQSQRIPVDFLSRHAIKEHHRANVIEFIYLLIISTKMEIQTFFLCVYIMDSFIAKAQRSICKDEFALIAFTSLLIASKKESTIPFSINDMASVINKSISSSEKITKSTIKQKEIEIMLAVNFDFVKFSLYDFIQIFLYDLKFNLVPEIKKTDIEVYLNKMSEYSLEIVKKLLLDVSFYKYNSLLTGVACIIIAFDMIKNNPIPENIDMFFSKWIYGLLERYPKKEVKEIYDDIVTRLNFIPSKESK